MFKKGDIIEWHDEGHCIVQILEVDRDLYIYKFMVNENNPYLVGMIHRYDIDQINRFSVKLDKQRVKKLKLELL